MTPRTVKTIGFTALAVLSLVLAACSSATPTTPTTPADSQPQAAQPKHGGTLTRVMTSTFTADPAMSQTPYSLWYWIGSPMLFRDPETYELKPGIFESWTVAPDGKEVTLKVRQGVKFHNKPPINGREVEARDLVYVIKSATGQQYPHLPEVRFPRKSNFEAVKEVTAVDKYTVKVTLARPSVSFLDGLGDYRSTWVYPDGIREAFGDVESLITPSVDRHIGPGPFVVTKFVNLVEMINERNPEYWDKPKPYFDRVRHVWIPDTTTQLSAFVSGQVDLIGTSDANTRDFITSNKKDAVILTYPPNSCWYRLSFNTTRKPLDDYRVRRALALVQDPKKMGEQIVGSWEGKPLWKYPSPVPWVFPEALPQEELAKHPLYQGPTPQNVAEARRLLKEAGYEQGFTVTMIYGSGSRTQDESEVIRANVEDNLPGVKLVLKPMDSEAHRALAAKGDYDIQNYCHIFDVTAVSHMYTAFHSKGGRNYPRLNDAKMDELLDKAEQELNPEKHKELLRQVQYRVFDTISFWPTYQTLAQIAIQPTLKGVRPGSANSYDVFVADWWRDQ